MGHLLTLGLWLIEKRYHALLKNKLVFLIVSYTKNRGI